MGAASALHLANRNPEMFDATAGVSGAYSTLDELGYQYIRLTVGARNGEATNMWGPRGSTAWAVFLSAATGLVGSAELGYFGSNELVLLDGHVLEKGSYESTRALERALGSVPAVNLRINYMPSGIHNWPVFVSQMVPAMDHILSGLAAAMPNGRASAGGAAGESLGSGSAGSGSAGSSSAAGSTGSGGSTGSLRGGSS